MASVGTLTVNGMVFPVVLLSSSAQSIDDAVTVLGAPTTPQAALSALGAGVRPRLGINMDFQINQRRQTSYTASGKTYTVDGWYLSNTGGTVTVNSDGTITLGTTNNNFWQLIPPDEFMMGAPFTFSALTSDGKLYTMTVDELSTSTNQSQTTDFGLIRAQYYNGNVGVNINPTQKSVTLLCAKPESGPNQTLAYQDSAGAWHRLPQPEDGDYAGQLLKCKWYLNKLAYAGGVGLTVAQSYFGGSSGTAYFPVPLDCPMRPGNPTIVSYKRMDIYSQSTGVVSDAVITAINQGNCLVFQAVKSGLSGSGFILTLNNVLVSNEL